MRAVGMVGAGLRWRSACNGGNMQCAVVAGFEYLMADAPNVFLDSESFAVLGNSTSVALSFEVSCH